MSLKRLEEGESAQSDDVFDAILATITHARPPSGETASNRHVLKPASASGQAGDSPATATDAAIRGGAEPVVAAEIRAVFAAVLGTNTPNAAGAPSGMLQMPVPPQPATPATAHLNRHAGDPLQDIAAFVAASSVAAAPHAVSDSFSTQREPQKPKSNVRHRATPVALCVAGLAIGVLAGALHVSGTEVWLPSGLFAQNSDPKSQLATLRAATLPSAAVAAPARLLRREDLQPTQANLPPKPPTETPVTTPVTLAAQTGPIVREADRLLQLGDIKGARDLLQTPADARQPIAMLLLGSSYDPLLIGTLPNANAAAHAPTAISWYRRAVSAGNAGAARRHNALMQHILQN